MTVQCCKCKRVRDGAEWIHRPPDLGDEVSHTYCPVCLDEARREIFAQHRNAHRILDSAPVPTAIR